MKNERINQGYYFAGNYYCMLESDPELTLEDVCVYGIVCSFCFTKGSCKAGDKYFAKMMRKSPRLIQKSIARLTLKGYLRKHLQGKKRTLWAVPLTLHAVPTKPGFDSIICDC